MVHAMAVVPFLLGANLATLARGGTELVIPTKIVANPQLFSRGQVISMKASFKQLALVCGPKASNGFELRLYDEKDVSNEPIYLKSKETKYIARSIATVGPKAEDTDKKVERDFEQFQIPPNAPARVYAVVWRTCSWRIRKGPYDPPIYEDKLNTKRIGGQFFKFSCPGESKIPTGKCAYRPE